MNNSIFAEGAGYVGGRFVPIAEATLPVTDWGFTRSDVVYDVVHVFKGGFFRLAYNLDRFEHSMAERRMWPGDTLVLYTDGITESFNDAGEDFGERRLIESLRRNRELPAEAL